MMRLLQPADAADTARIVRTCARWLREAMGIAVVEYRIGNTFTGSIDILAADREHVYLVTVTTGRLGDALLGALTGHRWFLENRGFLARVYQSDETDLALPPVLMILSPSFPPEIASILGHGLKPEVRLFQYSIFGSEDAPELHVEELKVSPESGGPSDEDIQSLASELGIERAGLPEGEIRDFLAAVRA
jgi:hypothetical protein